MRPVIGITSYVEPARWGVWDTRAAVLPYSYVGHVMAAGGRAVLLPPDDRDGGIVARLDGLLLTGGADIDPGQYNQDPHERTVTRPDRDAGELTLLRAAMDRDLPVLGICRGMQLITVAAGGALAQHLPDVVGHGGHQPEPGMFGDHTITVRAGSVLAGILGTHAVVNSYHHQSVLDPGGLRVTAHASDGVVEAVEDPTRRFLIGVQWHPEELPDGRLFEAFVRAAAATDSRP
jgi:putative glutamine amidotransferase